MSTRGSNKAAEAEDKSPAKDSLKVLNVITRMEVGPVHLERRRLVAPYRVIQNNKRDSFDLIYHFEEDVFDPEEPAAANLASMVGAQAAINYGLFSKEIIFHGPFDQVDKKFIEEMMANTSREIYVKKFLEPNIFLKGKAACLPVVKRKTYLKAKIIFADEHKALSAVRDKAKYEPGWPVQSSRHAVLSSGGKDSLLSFGLLHEICGKALPIFINESGRHWFTALNGYRYLKSKYPETARIWTNSDRLFVWMLRHFSFVRQDFSNVRSDEYPIRLWTVAVFLFGALPILRKRGIGRLIIGDEFDTTARASHRGIAHYNGLFDQSRYFDNALTRYYQRKKWNIHQFSIIRPLSEILIEKTLVERFPELQRNQVSCHATHTDGGRVHPCGRCEKCRRIVGMLLAVGADPSACGYSSEQIDYCLQSLARKRVHQENAGARHLTYLLKHKGLIPKPPKGLRARPQPEVMKVRFDPERSPLEAIPDDLRQPLLRIFLDHAQGAVKRKGRTWVDFNPFE
jgi:hypothetical protein